MDKTLEEYAETLIKISAELRIYEDQWSEFVVEQLSDRGMLKKSVPPGIWAQLKIDPIGKHISGKILDLKARASTIALLNKLPSHQLPPNLR